MVTPSSNPTSAQLELRSRCPDRATIAHWNQILEGKDPQAIIRFAVETFGSDLAIATQFGTEGCTLLHRVAQEDPTLYFFTIDTGLLFQETYRLADRIEKRLGIHIDRVQPNLSVGAQAVAYGPNLWERDPDTCCDIRKVQPMTQALAGKKAWMTSIRRGQSRSRAHTPIVQWDHRFNVVKFAPLAEASFESIQAYVDSHQVPTNPLRLLGYQSIGCMTCTEPTQSGSDVRSGRWAGKEKTECGLHGRFISAESDAQNQ